MDTLLLIIEMDLLELVLQVALHSLESQVPSRSVQVFFWSLDTDSSYFLFSFTIRSSYLCLSLVR